jgi:hypothetical protein
MICQQLVQYFLQARFWIQNLCYDTKCLHKTLVMKNMQFFLRFKFKFKLFEFQRIFLFAPKSIFQNNLIFRQWDAEPEKIL